MEIVPFEPEHLTQLHPPLMTPAQLRSFVRAYRPCGPAFTIVQRDSVLGCGGVIVAGDMGHAWAVLSDALRARPMVLHREVKRHLDQIDREFRLEQIFATVYEGFPAGRRWLERLGFREEGILTDYLGTGLTYRRSVR